MGETTPATAGWHRGAWPMTAGLAVGGVAIVTVLLLPLDAEVRSWTVRVLLVLFVLVRFAPMFSSRLDPSRSTSEERIGFQTVFLWGFVTGVGPAMPFLGDTGPAESVLGGAVAAVLYGAVMWVHDRATR